MRLQSFRFFQEMAVLKLERDGLAILVVKIVDENDGMQRLFDLFSITAVRLAQYRLNLFGRHPDVNLFNVPVRERSFAARENQQRTQRHDHFR